MKHLMKFMAAAVALAGCAGCAALERDPGESRTHTHRTRIGRTPARRVHAIPPLPAENERPTAPAPAP